MRLLLLTVDDVSDVFGRFNIYSRGIEGGEGEHLHTHFCTRQGKKIILEPKLWRERAVSGYECPVPRPSVGEQFQVWGGGHVVVFLLRFFMRSCSQEGERGREESALPTNKEITALKLPSHRRS